MQINLFCFSFLLQSRLVVWYKKRTPCWSLKGKGSAFFLSFASLCSLNLITVGRIPGCPRPWPRFGIRERKRDAEENNAHVLKRERSSRRTRLRTLRLLLQALWLSPPHHWFLPLSQSLYYYCCYINLQISMLLKLWIISGWFIINFKYWNMFVCLL